MLVKTASSLTALLCLSLASLGCAPEEEEERPGAIDLGGDGTPGTGSNNNNNMGGSDMGSADEVSGVVAQWVDDQFDVTTAFVSPSNVYIISEDGTGSSTDEFNGEDFEVEGSISGTRWVYVDPINDAATLPTITEHDIGSGSLTVPVMQAAGLDQIVASMDNPVEINDFAAQVFIKVVDSSGAGVPDAAITLATNSDVVAYRQEDSVWLSLDDGTSSSGLIYLPNIIAEPNPGQVISVVIGGSTEAEKLVQVIEGAVTFATIVVP